MTSKTKPNNAKALLEEEREMGAEIGRLEAELAELEAPSRPFTWEEIRAGAVEDLDRRERRKAVLPRMIAAAKVRLLEIRRERLEGDLGPLSERLQKVETKLQEVRDEHAKIEEREAVLHGERSDAHMALRYVRQEIKQIERDLRGLAGQA